MVTLPDFFYKQSCLHIIFTHLSERDYGNYYIWVSMNHAMAAPSALAVPHTSLNR